MNPLTLYLRLRRLGMQDHALSYVETLEELRQARIEAARLRLTVRALEACTAALLRERAA